MDDDKNIEAFEEFFQKIGIFDLPEDRQEQFLTDFLHTVNQRVSLRLATVLTPEQQEQLEGYDGNPENALDDIKRIYPDFGKLYAEEVEAVKREMLALMGR